MEKHCSKYRSGNDWEYMMSQAKKSLMAFRKARLVEYAFLLCFGRKAQSRNFWPTLNLVGEFLGDMVISGTEQSVIEIHNSLYRNHLLLLFPRIALK